MLIIFRLPILVVVFSSFISACAAPHQTANVTGDVNKLDGRDSNIELDVQGAEVISDGWIEYKVVLKNHGAQSFEKMKFIMTDENGVTHKAATSAQQLKQLPSGMNEAVARAGVTALLPSLMMMGVPFVGPMLSAGSSIGSAYSQDQVARMVNVQQSFPSISLTGRELFVNDELIGSLFFPAVVPASVKIGYIRAGKREWAYIGSSRPQAIASSSSKSSYTAPDPMTAEAQTLLNQLGYPCGMADGLSGPKTREAIKRYQTDAGISVDGAVSQVLLESLRNET